MKWVNMLWICGCCLLLAIMSCGSAHSGDAPKECWESTLIYSTRLRSPRLPGLPPSAMQDSMKRWKDEFLQRNPPVFGYGKMQCDMALEQDTLLHLELCQSDDPQPGLDEVLNELVVFLVSKDAESYMLQLDRDRERAQSKWDSIAREVDSLAQASRLEYMDPREMQSKTETLDSLNVRALDMLRESLEEYRSDPPISNASALEAIEAEQRKLALEMGKLKFAMRYSPSGELQKKYAEGYASYAVAVIMQSLAVPNLQQYNPPRRK